MKVKRIFDSVEISVILVGILMITAIVVFGFLKQGVNSKEPYVSNVKDDTTEMIEADTQSSDVSYSTLTLKQNSFTVKQNALLSDEVSTYFNGSETLLKKVSLDLSQVDMETVGIYVVSAKTDTQTYEFNIVVEESNNPSFTYDRNSFKYLVGAYSSMEEVIEMANVVAYDSLGNDISETIEGWPSTIPSTFGEQRYILTAKDSSGNVGYFVITVDFQKVVN